ncbi:hypothetical protein [Sphingomonas sp. UYEF23]|uniref:hypothetical protein n=1 Tax=unclassified Sphingomonas TaxID=196159 RepID=UPI003395C74B
MFRKLILPASLGLTALLAIIPGAASAQRYDGWNSQSQYQDGYHDRGDRRYDDRGYRGGGYARQRWIEHRRWQEQARRRHWQRERFEHGGWGRGRDWRNDGY